MTDKLASEHPERNKRVPDSHQQAESGTYEFQPETEDEFIRHFVTDANSPTLTPKAILSLQRIHGNRFVQRLLTHKRQPDSAHTQDASIEGIFPVLGRTAQSDVAGQVHRQVSEAISTQTPGDVVQRGKDKDITGFDRAIIPAKIHQGQQDKHIKTSSNYKNAVKSGVHKSALTADPADLLSRFHKDEFTVLAYDARRQSAVVDFDSAIGEVINETTGDVLNTTQYGSVRFGKGGVHIIPINYTV